MKADGKGIKAKVRGKLAATKAKVKGKCKGAKPCVAIALLALLCGCATSEPASRLTRAEYGDIKIDLTDARNCTVTLTLGDGALSSADAEDTNETQTATPTNTTDIKPDVDVNTTGGRTAGFLETAINAGAALIGTGNAKSGCTDGSCCDE